MYQKILTFSLIFIAAVAEVSLCPTLLFGRVALDIVLVMIIIWSSRQTFENFWLWAILAGVTLDLVALNRIGISAISFLIISFGMNSLSKRFFVGQRNRAFWGIAVAVIFGTIFNYAIVISLEALATHFAFTAIDYRAILLKQAGNLVVLAIIYRPLASSRIIFPAGASRIFVK